MPLPQQEDERVRALLERRTGSASPRPSVPSTRCWPPQHLAQSGVTMFLPRTLWYHPHNSLEQVHISHDQLLALPDCLVILGEAGMGKSTLLKALAADAGIPLCTARQLINQHDPTTLLSNGQLLIIDALDEVAAAKDGDAIDKVLQKLGAAGYPRFILSCRVADWQAATSTAAIEEQYGTPLVLHLDPLTEKQQLAFLSDATGDAARAKALLKHFAGFGLGMPGNPITLELIARLPAGEPLPKNRTALYRLAVDTLRQEANPKKVLQELPPKTALETAGAAYAAMLLTGKTQIVRQVANATEEHQLPWNEALGFAGDRLEAVCDTRLFEAAGQDCFTYHHRSIAEFLAASWLAKSADNNRQKRRRLLAMIRSDGLVPTGLRGLHAWLAQSPVFADDVIKADPVGFMEYGDADGLNEAQAKVLLGALEQAAAENPRFLDWKQYGARSLGRPALHDAVLTAIADRSRAPQLRLLLIDQLHGQALTKDMRALLQQLTLDVTETYAIRRDAGELLGPDTSIDWPGLAETIRKQGKEDSRRLAFEIMQSMRLTGFSDTQVVETVLTYDGLLLCAVPKEGPDRTAAKYWRLLEQVPAERIASLVDVFCSYLAELLPRHAGYEHSELIEMYVQLIVRQLHLAPPGPARLWRWIKLLAHQYVRGRDEVHGLAEWFRDHDETRRAIQRLVLLHERDVEAFRMGGFALADSCRGLAFTQADAIAFLAALDPADRGDERWKQLLWWGNLVGAEGQTLRDAAKPFAEHRADLMAWIDSLAEPKQPEWERKQAERDRKRRAEQAMRFAEHRKAFGENIAKMCAGEFAWLISPAQAYLDMFNDIDHDVQAHERIAGWLGDDLAAAALAGFEAFLNLPKPRPNAVLIAFSRAKGRYWNACDIVIAGLAERLRTRATDPFADVSSERLMAGLFALWWRRQDSHAKIEALLPALEAELVRRGDFECAVRLYIEPQLRKRCTYVDGLYALMRGEAPRQALRVPLALEWLQRFADLPFEPESEMLDALVTAGDQAAFATLAAMVPARLASPLNADRLAKWQALQIVTDFSAARSRLAATGISPDLLWQMRALGGGWQHDRRPPVPLSPEQLQWLFASLRGHFPNVHRPSGVTSCDDNPWDAADYLGGLAVRLAKDLSDEAEAALAALRDAPEDDYTPWLKALAAEQRQLRAENRYNPPSLADVQAVMQAGPPSTATDLQAVMLDALTEVQDKLKGHELNWYQDFFYPGSTRHRDENACRDVLLKMMTGHIPGVTMRKEDHVADAKRIDITCEIPGRNVMIPIEVKGEWHSDLWTAADLQLDHLYVNDWRAEAGIYLVLWFGGQGLRAPPKGTPKPDTPNALQAALTKTSKAAQQGRVAVVVLDLTRPTQL